MRAWISVTDFPARFGKADVRAFATACHIKNQPAAEQRRGQGRAGQGMGSKHHFPPPQPLRHFMTFPMGFDRVTSRGRDYERKMMRIMFE